MSKTSRTKLSVFLAAGIAAVILAAALSVFYGSTKIPFETVLQALRAPDMTDQQQIIIHELRIPRTIGCILVGAAFAVAGAIMQGVTRNPLADSGLLGINAGASFALAVCLAFLPSLSFSGVVLFSFLGAAVAMVTRTDTMWGAPQPTACGTRASIFPKPKQSPVILFSLREPTILREKVTSEYILETG